MSKDKLTDYDATASNNTDVGGISVAEGMLPSGVNNAIREQMSHLKDFASGTTGIDVLSLADDDASHAIKLQAPSAVTANTTFTLPDGDGTADQVLKTDGSGQLGWVAQTAVASNPSLIINGAMQVAQRGISAVAAGNPNYPSIDRYKAWEGTDGAFTIEQSTDAPTGFSKSLKAQVTTADTSLAAGQYAQIVQNIEAQDLQHLDYGLSTAKTLTLSFWVKSSKTGTYCITAYKEDTTGSAVTLLFPKEYTISSANTWEQKTITIAPDSQIKAATGAIDDDNGVGIGIYWNLAQGSTYTGGTNATWSSNTNHFATTNQVNWMDSTSNNFYLTGIKLEIGEVATPFEHEDIGTTLAKCSRYYTDIVRADNQTAHLVGYVQATTVARFGFHVPMRASPTITETNFNILYAGGGEEAITSVDDIFQDNQFLSFRAVVSGNLTVGQAVALYSAGAARFAFDAEL